MATNNPLSIRAWREPDDHESLFLQRYQRLLHNALQLTRHVRHEAEDLVHEPFVQFTVGRPDLTTIHNLDGYLYGTLRHLRLSDIRRALRAPVIPLSVVDYDSAELCARQLDARMRLVVHDDLVHVCEWACERSRTSRAGSVLLLRFVHGYYPDEIARILRSRVRAVDDWLRLARQEARAALESPTRMTRRFLHDADKDSANIVGQIRAAVFRASDGSCKPDRLAWLYRSDNGTSPPTAVLSHIVTCRPCLDGVSALLGLPPVADRYPTDTLGPGSRTGGDAPHVGGRRSHEGRAADRRRRERLAHRPKALQIAVNGIPLGSHTIAPGYNEQTLAVTLPEPIGFIEAFSEQGLRLLMLPIDPPPGGACHQTLATSLGTTRLALSVDFGGERPLVGATFDSGEAAGVDMPVPAPPRIGHDPTPPRRFAWWRWPLAGPALATLLIAIAAVWRVTHTRDAGVDVSALLRDAAVHDAAAPPGLPILVHRTLMIEERQSGETRLLRNRRVEVWEDPITRASSRRLFGEGGREIAAEWIDDEQRVTVLERGTSPTVRRTVGKPSLPDTPADLWRYGASTQEVVRLVDRWPVTTASDQPQGYVVEYRPRADSAPTWLLKVRVVLAKPDRRLNEVAWLVSEGGRPIEYRVIHVTRRFVPRDSVPPGILRIDPSTTSEQGPVPPAQATVTPARTLRLPIIELELLRRLHDVGACLGEQVSVERTSRGTLRIAGVVDNMSRKDVIEAAVRTLVATGALELQVETASALIERATGIPSVRHVDVPATAFPSYDVLRRHFLAELVPDPPDGTDPMVAVDQRVRSFADQMLQRSRVSLLHVWALKRLDDRFSTGLRSEGGAEAARAWRALALDHLLATLDNLGAVRDELGSVFATNSRERTSDVSPPTATAAHLLESMTHVDTRVRAMLTQSSDIQDSARIDSDGLWRSLAETIAIARALERTVN